MKKYISWLIAAIFIIVNLLVFRTAYITGSPIKNVEKIASAVTNQTLSVLDNKYTPLTQGLINSNPLLVIWAKDGSLNKDVQLLLPTFLWPEHKDEITYLIAITEIKQRDGVYIDGQPGYQINYKVEIISYSNAQELAYITLEGSSAPSSKRGSGPAYGTPPTNESITSWIESQIGAQ